MVFPIQGNQKLQEILDALRIHLAHRFIQDKKLRMRHKDRGQRQTLPLPAIWGWPLATNVVGYLASVFIGALICALGVLYVSPKNAR